MAKEYAKHNPSIIDGGNGRFEYDYESPRLDYIAGANDIIEEIEKAIEASDNPLAKLGYVVDVIEQLKGE